MLKFDFFRMNDISSTDYQKVYDQKNEVYEKFHSSDMVGWTNHIDISEVERMIHLSEQVKKESQCLVVIGIGGSFLGSYAVLKMLSNYFNDDSFPIIYAGTTLSSKYMSELLDYLKDIDFSVNVISKSGTTMETMMTYQMIKQLMAEKYDEKEQQKRIIVTTDQDQGILRQEVNQMGYQSFEIPNNIGGRYSIMTPAHLLPLAFNVDIKKLIDGYYQGEQFREEAFQYAVVRKCLANSGKWIENYCVYEESLYYFTEWLKQLFGETEGKNGQGIFPVSMVHTRDLHSLGQFIQQGRKIVFETFIEVEHSNKLLYNGQDLHTINGIVLESVRKAHFSGDVACLKIGLDYLNEVSIGQLLYFFMLSAAFSGYLFQVEPFDQPGVEVYKKEIKENLGVLSY